MARGTFGGTSADFVYQATPTGVMKLASATLTFWTAQTGGTQYTDLLLGGGAVTSIPVGADGRTPTFQGPDNVVFMWASASGSARVRVVDLGNLSVPDGTVEALVKNTGGVGPLTSAALSNTYARVFTPEAYGAVGDGVTNDKAAFDSAIAAIAAAGGGILLCRKPSYYIASDVELNGNYIHIQGLPDRGTRFLFAPTAQFRVKPGAFPYDFQVSRLILENVMFYPATAAARSKATVQLNDALYVTAHNCTFYGDTPRTQAALKMQATLYVKFDKCDFWGGSAGILGGDAVNSPNDVVLDACNFNDSTKAIAGVFFALNITGGSCQSVTDGFVISGNVNQASSTINIEGVYFEGIPGRCVDAGSNGFVYNFRLVGNYIASLAASAVAPVYIKRVVGYTIENNHWSGFNASVVGLVEIAHDLTSSVNFPRKGRIEKNVTPFTDERGQYFFASGMSADNKSLLAGTNEGFGTNRKKVRTTPFKITAAGTINAVLLDAAKPRFIHSAKLVCDEAFDGAATLNVGVSVALGFHVNAAAIGVVAGQSFTSLTLDNAPTRPANGVIFARIVTTVVTTAGSFYVDLEYSESDAT